MWLPFGDKQATSGAAGVLCDSGAGQSDLAFWIFSLRSPRRTPLLRIAEEPLHLGPLCLELCPKHREAETPMSRALAREAATASAAAMERLFSDTTTELFFSHHIDPQNPLKLKLDYSRNLTMVFKEICSNILKHAAATEVTVNLVLKENNMLWLEVTDNGKGFDETVIKGGNGLRNIRNRIMRMNGEIKITAVPGKGTKTDILLKDIFSS